MDVATDVFPGAGEGAKGLVNRTLIGMIPIVLRGLHERGHGVERHHGGRIHLQYTLILRFAHMPRVRFALGNGMEFLKAISCTVYEKHDSVSRELDCHVTSGLTLLDNELLLTLLAMRNPAMARETKIEHVRIRLSVASTFDTDLWFLAEYDEDGRCELIKI